MQAPDAVKQVLELLGEVSRRTVALLGLPLLEKASAGRSVELLDAWPVARDTPRVEASEPLSCHWISSTKPEIMMHAPSVFVRSVQMPFNVHERTLMRNRLKMLSSCPSR